MDIFCFDCWTIHKKDQWEICHNQLSRSSAIPNYGPETAKAHLRRREEDFYKKYCQGKGIDIGYRGSIKDADPIINAIGIDLDYPGYDGKRLPFNDNEMDFVYSSHCLEHITNWEQHIKEIWRVTKIGGYIILCVPHMYLYEKKWDTPSNWNGDHKRFYTPGSLLIEVENSLQPNSYRVIYLKDCAEGFDYSIPPHQHSGGEYQIELVLQKSQLPNWQLEER